MSRQSCACHAKRSFSLLCAFPDQVLLLRHLERHMRYYLHLVTGTRFIRDPDGAEFSGVAEAGAEAAQSARDLMSDELRRGRPIPYDWRMLVATEDDTILKTIPFSVVAHGDNPGHERKAVPVASPVRD